MLRALRPAVLLAAVVYLAGCAAGPQGAPDPEIERLAYRSDGPAYVALITNINNRSDRGAHSALIIAGSETVVFNPAGTWWHPDAPERGDLHHGFTPAMERWFIDYHARETYRVEIQRRAVPPETAEMLLARARAYGSVTESFCTIAVSRVLRGAPGFEDFPVVLMPSAAQRAFARYPGVETEVYRDDSPGDRSDLIAVTVPKAPEPGRFNDNDD